MKIMQELLGRTVNEVYLDKSQQHAIRFMTDQGPIQYRADGDCCSESWFYAVSGLDALLNQIVTNVEEIYMDEKLPEVKAIIEDGKTRQEYDQLYSVKITTPRGVCELEFRNSSNGYYGGTLEQDHDPLSNRNWYDPTCPMDMQPLTKDYTA